MVVPLMGMRPASVLIPESPPTEAGMRIEPPPSVPVPRAIIPAANAAAVPPDEPLHRFEILDPDRDTRPRTRILAPGQAGVEGGGVAPSPFGVNGHEGVELGVERLDAFEGMVGDLPGGELSAADHAGQVGQTNGAEVDHRRSRSDRFCLERERCG